MDEVLTTRGKIARNAPLSIRQAKRSMTFGARMDLRSAMFFEIDAYNQLVGTDDRRERSRLEARCPPAIIGAYKLIVGIDLEEHGQISDPFSPKVIERLPGGWIAAHFVRSSRGRRKLTMSFSGAHAD